MWARTWLMFQSCHLHLPRDWQPVFRSKNIQTQHLLQLLRFFVPGNMHCPHQFLSKTSAEPLRATHMFHTHLCQPSHHIWRKSGLSKAQYLVLMESNLPPLAPSLFSARRLCSCSWQARWPERRSWTASGTLKPFAQQLESHVKDALEISHVLP